MRALPERPAGRVDVSTIEVVRDAQVAVTVCNVANDLEAAADVAGSMVGGGRLEELLLKQAKALRELLGKDPAR